MGNEKNTSPGYAANLMLATLFGIGFFPTAPGTWASAFTLIIFWLLPEMSWAIELLLLVVIFLLGVKSSTRVEQVSERVDPGYIVIDEFIGMALVLITIPKSYVLYLFAFLLFRIFDIMKPMPVNQLQELPAGWGVMVDDVAAGIYALIILQIGILIF